jgi:hypothetical protein
MQTDCSDEHPQNADSPSFESLEGDSNVKLASFVQCWKHSLAIVFVDEGIQIA